MRKIDSVSSSSVSPAILLPLHFIITLMATKTDLSLAGCAAHFSLFGVQQDFHEIPADKTLYLVFPSSVTSKFPLGMANGNLWLTDSEGRIRTVSSSIHFLVTKNVEKAYGDPDGQSISVLPLHFIITLMATVKQ